MVLKYVAAAGVADAAAKRRRSQGQPGPKGGMGFFAYFPLLAIPVIVYNLMAFGGSIFGGAGTVIERLRQPLFEIPMASVMTTTTEAGETITQRVTWALTPGDLLLAVSLFLVFVELLKSTGTGRSSIVNHALSFVIFMICMIQFLLLAPFATSVFFLITVMALLDVLAGFIITVVTARRDIAVGEGFN